MARRAQGRSSGEKQWKEAPEGGDRTCGRVTSGRGHWETAGDIWGWVVHTEG